MSRNSAPWHFSGTKRFRLDARLGAGATGAVYAAYDREYGSHVALKFLTRWQPTSVAAFKQEFRSLQGVRHRNLVELRELIFDDGNWFLTMELVRGVDFLSFVRGSAAIRDVTRSWVEAAPGDDTLQATAIGLEIEPEARAAHVGVDEGRLRSGFVQLAQGLNYLHSTGKVHRDIKPSNVLVDHDGRVVIVDFGLVTTTSRSGTGAGQSEFLGTPRYMSPEQAARKALGPASDWYSAGVLLFEALTGQTPAHDVSGDVSRRAPSCVCAEVPRDLDRLCAQLLAEDADARPTGEGLLTALAPPRESVPDTSPLGVGFGDQNAFVGRAQELCVLQAALDAVNDGEAVTVVIEGESGVGKTSLLREFLATARSRNARVRTLAGRCFEGESLPYKAMDGLIDAVYSELSGRADTELDRLLPPDGATVAEAFPSLRRLRVFANALTVQSTSPVDPGTPRKRRARAFAALRELFVRLAAEGTLVVVLDDMQWTDSDSLSLLSALTTPPAAPRMLTILAKRPGGQEFRPTQQIRRLTLGNLSDGESLSLVTNLMQSVSTPRAAARIRELTREAHGHPLFLLELARMSDQLGESQLTPVRFDDVVWHRIEKLSAPARLLLELSAVAGRPLAQSTIAEAAVLSDDGRDSEESLAADKLASHIHLISELRHARLIRTHGTLSSDALEPYHDRIREAVVARIHPVARKSHHWSLARAIEHARAPDPETLVEHFRGAGKLDRAREYAIVAAHRAQGALAFDSAARLFRLSLDLGLLADAPLRDLQHSLAEALVNAGRSAEAAEAYRVAGAGDDSLLGLRRQRLAAEQLLRSGHVGSGMLAMSVALRKLGLPVPRSDVTAFVSLLALRARLELRNLRYEERAQRELSALEAARIDGLWTAATCLTMFDNVRSAELQSRGILRALEAGTKLQVLRAHTAESIFVATSGKPRQQRVAQILSVATRLATELDDPYGLGWVGLSRGATSFLLGNWQESKTQCGVAEAIFQARAGAAWELGSAKAFGTWSAMMLGHFREARERVPAHVMEAESRGDLYAATLHMTGFSNAAWLAAGDVATARQMLTLAEQRWSRKKFDVPRYLHMVAGAYMRLYEFSGLAAYARVLQDWSRLRWGVAFRAQITRFGMRTVRGLAALAAFDESHDSVLLRDAAACGRAIDEEGVTWSRCFGHMILAGVAWRRKDPERALHYLASAEESARATDMSLHRAVLGLRRGEVIGGEMGRTLIEQARAFMSGEGIVDLESMSALLTPTFPS